MPTLHYNGSLIISIASPLIEDLMQNNKQDNLDLHCLQNTALHYELHYDPSFNF